MHLLEIDFNVDGVANAFVGHYKTRSRYFLTEGMHNAVLFDKEQDATQFVSCVEAWRQLDKPEDMAMSDICAIFEEKKLGAMMPYTIDELMGVIAETLNMHNKDSDAPVKGDLVIVIHKLLPMPVKAVPV